MSPVDPTLDAPLGGALDEHLDSSGLSEPAEQRYEDLGLIAAGGMGEVRRVQDGHLDRVVAMKRLRWDRARDPGLRRRFEEEVLRTAGLQHPGIVSVYDWGEDEGGLWYTMPEVHGRTLGEHIQQAHSSQRGGDGDDSELRRLVAWFASACQAMAYAHSRGVIHRDLKPDNIMVGAFGEVLVMDFGLARRLEDGSEEPVTDGVSSGAGTLVGQVLGTPAYMAPEQATGDLAQVGPHSDVYALGACLYEVLSGRAPRPDGGMAAVLAARTGPPPQVSGAAQGAPWSPPEELVSLCEEAMVHAAAARSLQARDLAQGLTSWLDGARRRDRAQALVDEALGLDSGLAELSTRATELRARANEILGPLPSHAPVAEKLPGWELEDEADALDNRWISMEGRKVELLESALRVLPEHSPARRALADCHRLRVLAAELRRDEAARIRAEEQLRTFDDGRHAAFLRGEGRLSVRTEPPGATVRLERQEPRERRLQGVDLGSLGSSPVEDHVLPGGSYVLHLEHPGHLPVRYPVLVEREGHWDGRHPAGHQLPVLLPREGELREDEVYVPAGWFRCGGDEEAADSLPAGRVWVDGFVIRRTPVTNAEYLRFLTDLQARGEDPLPFVPRKHMGVSGATDAEAQLVYHRNADGSFTIPDDPDVLGHTWRPDWPVVLVDWAAARAFCDWLAETTGQPWRLPDELEREKATRGVDGRAFPWGDFCDPTWARMFGSEPGPPSMAPVGTHPVDRSVYGLLDGAGNSLDWCGNTWLKDGPPLEAGRLLLATHDEADVPYKAVRGGAWGSVPRMSRAAGRLALPPGRRLGKLGIRPVRSFRGQTRGPG